ncbi:hypothetical protein SLS63_007153 [Diaporthe eres]|uniref:Uncharacterized protein n=1 Tax=Diaporthe eres TaxID=83184 RepID=A0ABR1P678_DIAER
MSQCPQYPRGYPQGYLQVPSYDGPSDTRSQGSHHSGGGSRSHSRLTSQVSGSHVSASHPGSQTPGSAPPSNTGAPSGSMGSRPPSNMGSRSPPRGYPKPLGFDPGRLSKKDDDRELNKNIGYMGTMPTASRCSTTHPYAPRPVEHQGRVDVFLALRYRPR